MLIPHAYLPADVLLGKFKRDVSFALRRGTIAQVTTHLALDGYAWPTRARPPRMRSSPSMWRVEVRFTLSNYYADKLLLSLSPQEREKKQHSTKRLFSDPNPPH